MKSISANSYIRKCAIVLPGVFLLMAGPALSQYEISWYTIDGGGGASSGGPYVLTGTIGQPDADWASGGKYELLGGFWPGEPIECFPSSYSTYNDWVAIGKPNCWCEPYQCDGDADGGTETFFNYRVYGKDLGLIVDTWKRKIDDPLLDPCADIDHKSETFFNYRVYGKDLAAVVTNWKKKDTDLAGDCPRVE